jgi:hypothetical protein
VLLSIYLILFVSNIVYHKVSQLTFIARVQRDLLRVLKSLFGFTLADADAEYDDDLSSETLGKTVGASTDTGNFVLLRIKPLEVSGDPRRIPIVIFLNAHDEKISKSLQSSAGCLGKMHVHDLDVQDRHIEETFEHTIVYSFTSKSVAISHLERIAVLSEASLSFNHVCQHCQLPPLSRFLSLKTGVNGRTVTLRILRQSTSCSLVSASHTTACVSCGDQKPHTVFQLIAIIKKELSISPSDISVECLSPHSPAASKSKPLSVYSTVISKESLVGIDLSLLKSGERRDGSWMVQSKPCLQAVHQHLKNCHKVLCWPSCLPCPYTDIDISVDFNEGEGEGEGSLSISAQMNNIDLTSLSEGERSTVLERLHFYELVDDARVKVNKLDAASLQELCMKYLCVSSILLFFDSLRQQH